MHLFRSLLIAAMRWRWVTIGLTVAALALAIFGMRYVQQQFFPASDRPEILVDVILPQSSSIAETRRQMDELEKHLKGDQDIERWSSYVGQGAVRFYLPLDQQLANAFFGQIVVQTKSLAARNRVFAKLQHGRSDFVGTDVFVHLLDLGPPVGGPSNTGSAGRTCRSSGSGHWRSPAWSAQMPTSRLPTFDWNEPVKVVRVEIQQDRARQLGITAQDIANFLNGGIGGTNITQVRDSIYLVNIVSRAQVVDRLRSARWKPSS